MSGCKGGERKSPLGVSHFPRPHWEWLEVLFCVFKVTTAIISKHITMVIHGELYKGQGVSWTESMASEIEPITGCIKENKTTVDKRF